MAAKTCEASWLRHAFIRKEICMPDWRSESRNSPVRMNRFDIFSVSEIQPSRGILLGKEGACGIESDDGVDSTIPHIFPSDPCYVCLRNLGVKNVLLKYS